MKKTNKSNNKGCLFLVLGTLCVILGLFVYLFLTGRLTGLLMQAQNGDVAAYGLLHLSYPCTIACFILLEALLFIRFIPSDEDMKKKRSFSSEPEEKKRKIPYKTLMRILTVGIIAVVLLASVVSANTYTLVSKDGVRSHFFVDINSYTWEDVKSYKVDCDSSKGLSMTLTMNDGKKFELLQGPTSATSKYSEEYDDILELAVEIDGTLKSMDIPKNTSHVELAKAFYKNDFPTRWEYVVILTEHEELTDDPEVNTDTSTESATEETDSAE